jgi:hypothetical protein
MNEHYKNPDLELLGCRIKKNKLLAIFGYPYGEPPLRKITPPPRHGNIYLTTSTPLKILPGLFLGNIFKC